MPSYAKVQNGFYRGIPVRFTQSNSSGGRKTVVHTFPNSDAVITEDLGALPKRFSLTFIVSGDLASGDVAESYTSRRDALLTALNAKGTAEFIHPYEGSLTVQLDGPYNIRESISNVGRAEVEVSFIKQLIVDDVLVNASAVYEQREIASEQVQDEFSEEVEVNSPKTAEEAKSFKGKCGEAFDTAEQYIKDTTTSLNEYKAKVSDFKRKVFVTPTALMNDIRGVFASANELITEARDGFDFFNQFFAFNDTISLLTESTLSNIQFNKNVENERSAMQVLGTVYAAGKAVDIDYKTDQEIREIEDVLYEQFDKLNNASYITSDMYAIIQEQRIIVNTILSDAILNVQKVTTINITNAESLSKIVYKYYGNLDNYETIKELNNLDDTALVKGEIQILTA